jgi:hypothetical protein
MHDWAINSIAVRHLKVGDKVHYSVKARCKAKADNRVTGLQDTEWKKKQRDAEKRIS